MPPTMGGPTEAEQGDKSSGPGRSQRRREDAAYVWRKYMRHSNHRR